MNDLTLVVNSIKDRWLSVLLSVLLTALGVTLVIIITQFGHHLHNRLTTDGKGIDIVVGAKGSPLQLVLSSVYHIDIPTGNMNYSDAQKWMKHPHVKQAIPLALGDNWKGRRIVGTTPAYIHHYKANLNEGRLWNKDYEVVVGSAVALNIGTEFVGAHGITGHGHVHEDDSYTVVGVLKPTGTVLDRLILTSLNSVLDIHGQEVIAIKKDHSAHHDDHHDHGHHKHQDHGKKHDHATHEEDEHNHDHHGHAHHDEAHAKPAKQSSEITALLLTTKSPIANINLPRTINRESALQAANPALETARLSAVLGIGLESFSALSFILIAIAAISVFSGLASGLENRSGDLAVLRALGYTKARVAIIILTEGILITVAGVVSGIAIAIFSYNTLCSVIPPLALSGAKFVMSTTVIYIIGAVITAGVIASLLPALRAANVDVVKQLSLRS